MNFLSIQRTTVISTILTLLITISSFSIAIAQEPQETTSTQQAPVAQAIGGIPTKYNTMFSVEWSGGSLYQLKAQLATQGCILNDIIVTEDETTYAYNQYETPSTDQNKQAFLKKYEHFIPAGTLQASCYNICEFRFVGDTKTRECLTMNQMFERMRYFLGRLRESSSAQTFKGIQSFALSRFSYDIEHDRCGDDWHPVVKEKVFEMLPLPSQLCIMRDSNVLSFYGGVGGAFDTQHSDRLSFLMAADAYVQERSLNTYSEVQDFYTRFVKSDQRKKALIAYNVQPLVYVRRSADAVPGESLRIIDMPELRSQRDREDLQVEIHELCHANQHWQLLSSLTPDRVMTHNVPHFIFVRSAQNDLLNTLSFREFNAIVGFNADGTLDKESMYRNIYGSHSPIELSAELCALYILDHLGYDSQYAYKFVFQHENKISSFVQLGALFEYVFDPEFDVNTYLTPEVRAWIEKYMLGTRA